MGLCGELLGRTAGSGPRAEFAEFPPAAPSLWSPAFPSTSPAGSVYVHTEVAWNPLFKPVGAGPAVELRGGMGEYPWYRSDLWAHLVGVGLCGLDDGVVTRVEGVLMEAALGLEEVRKLDGGEGWAGLVEWLVLVLRCERMWRVSRRVFTVSSEGPQPDR